MLTTSLPHEGDPGAGAFVAAMAAALARRGHRVVLVGSVPATASPCAAPGVDLEVVRDVDGGVFSGAGAPERLRFDEGVPRALDAWRGARVVGALARRASSVAPRVDAWVSHFVLPSALVVAGVARSRPHLAVVHGSDGWLLARAPRVARDAVLRCASAWRFTHPALRDAVLCGVRAPDVVEVAPMGFDGTAGVPGLRDVVVSMGRLVSLKRFDVAVDAIAAASRTEPLPWVVLGDGSEREALVARAAARGVDVRFEGAVEGVVRDAWLRRARVFLHTAGASASGRGEGAPVSLLEAMGAGAAVVATDSGGVRWIVGDAGTVLPASTSADDIGAAVLRAWRGELPGGAEALARVAPWRWDQQAASLERTLFG